MLHEEQGLLSTLVLPCPASSVSFGTTWQCAMIIVKVSVIKVHNLLVTALFWVTVQRVTTQKSALLNYFAA
jgi:hypothetical protein